MRGNPEPVGWQILTLSTLTWSCTSWGWYPKCRPALPCWWTSVCWGRTSSHRSPRSPSGPEQRNRAALTGGAAAPPHEEPFLPGHLGLWPPSSARYAGTCRWCGWSPSCWRTTGPLGSRQQKHMTGEEGSGRTWHLPAPTWKVLEPVELSELGLRIGARTPKSAPHWGTSQNWALATNSSHSCINSPLLHSMDIQNFFRIITLNLFFKKLSFFIDTFL